MKYFIILVLAFCSIESKSQTAYRQKVFAFVQKLVNGESKHFVYIEMPGDSIPIWDSAVIERKKFVVHFSPINEMRMQVGKRKSDSRMVVLKSTPDSKMWMVDFDATNETIPAGDMSTDNAAVTFRGRFKGRKLNYKILKEVELEGEE